MRQRIVLDDIQSSRGNRTDGYINFGRKPDGSQFRIPVIIIEGGQDGPSLLVDACTHGDEYEGAEAVIRIAGELEGKSFAGRFIGVPALNLEAFACISRASITDGFNLNRIYPGNKDTYITHRLAALYLERVVACAEYCITFHGGGDVLHLEPIVGCLPSTDPGDTLSFEMAKAFGQKYIWDMSTLPFVGTSIESYKELCGTVSILPEIGSHCGRLYDRTKNVTICYDGIKNVMNFLGMIKHPAAPRPSQMIVQLCYLHASNGGIQHLYKKENDIVEKGEPLGVITDVFGNVVEELAAPYSGVVIGFWSVPVIRPGDWWLLYAKILQQ